MAAKNAYLLMTAKKYPNNWDIQLMDVKSRISTMHVVEIQQPTESAILLIIDKMFKQRGLKVKQTVVEYIANHIERSYEAVNYWVNIIDQNLVNKNQRPATKIIKKIIDDYLR
jgi:chromosomal replication initiation ATPase DnaA